MIRSTSAFPSRPLKALSNSLRRNLRRWKNIARTKRWKKPRSGIRLRRASSSVTWMMAEETFGRGQKASGGSTRTISARHWLRIQMLNAP